MNWLDRIMMTGGLVLLFGCSDDGLAPPPADTDGASAGVTSSATSGAESDGGESLTATATATATEGESETADPGGTTGNEDTGPDDSTGGEIEEVCTDETECMLVNDCCQCTVAQLDEPIPECPVDCKVPLCDELGIADIGLVCDEGGCAFEPTNCSDALITCDAPTPECPEGTLPEVTPEGDCWTGACAPLEACDGVPSCEYCTEDEACIEIQTEVAPVYECEPLGKDCAGTPSCACLPDACEAPYDTCTDEKGPIVCSCLEC